MAALNRVFLIGNLTKDPEIRYTPSGTAVANLRLAVNRMFRDRAGELKQDTCFITAVAWGKQAESSNQYLKKGRPVFIEGQLQSRSWEGKDGRKRSVIEVRASRIQFLSTGMPKGETAKEGVDLGPSPDEETVDFSEDEIDWDTSTQDGKEKNT